MTVVAKFAAVWLAFTGVALWVFHRLATAGRTWTGDEWTPR